MRSSVAIGLFASACLTACSDPGGSDPVTLPGAGASGGGAGGSAAGAPGGNGGAIATGGAGGTTGSGVGGTGAGGGSGGSAGSGGTSGGGTSGGGTSGGGTAGGGSSGVGGAGGSSTGPFPPVSDYQAPGPFGSTTMTSTGPGNVYTVYRPTALAPNGAKNPIVGWMSGGATSHTGYTLLPHLASHGFVIVAADTIPGAGQEVELGRQIIAGIDWAIAENGRAGSVLFGKLDVTKLASMGYSMGSLATFTIANDPRLTTTVHISGGNFVPERVNNLHAPAAFLCGRPGPSTCNLLSPDCDIAAVNCDTDFAGAKTPVFYGNFPGGHLGILTTPHMERIRGVTTAWLRWQLMQDTTLRATFAGAQCKLCSDPNWTVKQKSL